MKEFKNLKIIGVDHGYGNIKTAGTVTKNGVTAYETEPIFSGNILEYGGMYYRIGDCHKEFIPDKASDEDYYLLTLMAVARELNLYGIREADVHLAAGLPLTWIRRQREEFRGYLLRNPEVTYCFNKKEYHIRLAGCSLYPQGYPAVVSRLKDFRGTNLLADIGNGTMNILYINNKKAVESRCWTEKFGVSQCMTAARNAVMDTFGVRIDEATIEQVFRHGTADIGKPYLDCITSAARQYVADIFATLRRYEYNPDLIRLYIVGGGGCLIRNFGRYEESRVTFIDDICATAKGYEALVLSAIRCWQAAPAMQPSIRRVSADTPAGRTPASFPAGSSSRRWLPAKTCHRQLFCRGTWKQPCSFIVQRYSQEGDDCYRNLPYVVKSSQQGGRPLRRCCFCLS